MEKTDLDEIQRETAKRRVGFIIKLLEPKKNALQRSYSTLRSIISVGSIMTPALLSLQGFTSNTDI